MDAAGCGWCNQGAAPSHNGGDVAANASPYDRFAVDENGVWFTPPGDGAAYRSALLSQGFMTPTDSKRRAWLTDYLQSRNPSELVRHVPRVGWHGRFYVLPDETLGSNDNGEGTVANVLADSRSVRSDIRSDLDGSNTQPGAAMNLAVSVVDPSGAPLAGRAVYVWHCNKEGEYSEYNTRMGGGDFSDRSFLRGVQVTDANGTVNFTSILPGRYQGRAFHIHFEVFGDETYAKKALTSQMAIDDDLITSIYTDAGYATGLRNVTTNAGDNVFGDGVEHQLLDVTGTASSGLTARFTAVLS